MHTKHVSRRLVPPTRTEHVSILVLLALAAACMPSTPADDAEDARVAQLLEPPNAKRSRANATRPQPEPTPPSEHNEVASPEPAIQPAVVVPSPDETAARETFLRVYQEQWDEAAQRAAKKRGFAEARVGLGFFLGDVLSKGWPANKLRSVAVILGNYDNSFKVRQVVGKQALVMGDDFALLMPASSRTYEGMALSTLVRTLRVTGTTTYPTVIGSRQAFVVEPIEDFDGDVDAEAITAVARAMAKDGRVALGEYADGRLRACIDVDLAKLSPKFFAQVAEAAYTGTPSILLGSCSEFSREPLTRCTLPGGGTFSAYVDLGSEAADEAGCKESRGVWQRRSGQ